MTAIAPQPVVISSQRFTESPSIVLYGISWETYVNLRRETDASGQRLWLTYDEGTLEIMPPLPTHERWKTIIGDLLGDMCVELDIDVEPFGSTTFCREDLNKGVEPDECYYIRHAEEARRFKDVNLATSPPPDLAIEIDFTSPSVKRQPIYAAMGVPELWRMDDTGLSFLSLSLEKKYVKIDHSVAFPFLAPVDLERFVLMQDSVAHNQIRRVFRQWLHETFKGPERHP